jgi:hypothetical protein
VAGVVEEEGGTTGKSGKVRRGYTAGEWIKSFLKKVIIGVV